MATMSTAAATRKTMDAMLAAVRPASRYQDIAMTWRRLTAVFIRPVRAGEKFSTTVAGADGVEFEALDGDADGVPIPVASTTRRASTTAADGVTLYAGGEVVGHLRAEVVLRAGGRWDYLRRSWAPELPQQVVVFDLQESQIEFARWFARWLARYKLRQVDPAARAIEDPDLDFSAYMLYGGRRGGKTTVLILASWAVAIDIPTSAGSETIVWLVSVVNPERQEIDREIREWIPSEWYSYRELPQHEYTVRHGSRITNVSADNPETLKRGRADWVLLNEGAKMPRTCLDNSVGATADRGGIVCIATNPPTRQKGAWVRDIIEMEKEAKALGKPYPIRVLKLNHQGNAAIDRRARTRAGEVMRLLDAKLAAADDEGLVLAIGDLIFHEYDRVRHGIHYPPELPPDITRQITKKLYQREMDFIAGVDFQDKPFIYASFYKVYGTLDKPILWAVGELFLKGSEEEFIEMVFDEGFVLRPESAGQRIVTQEVTPHNVLWVGDSSATWQNSKHAHKEPPSFTYFKNAGCHITAPTKVLSAGSKHPANPRKEHSYPQCNRLFKEGRINIAPHVAKLNNACKECIAKPGKYGLTATGDHAHPIDTLRYVAWYVDPPLVKRSRGGQTVGRAQAGGAI